jgi:hypothetical protein
MRSEAEAGSTTGQGRAGTRERDGQASKGQREERRNLGGVLRGLAVLALAVPLGVAAGCAPSDEDRTAAESERRREIQQTLEEYLPVLADSYRTGDVEQLRPWAVERVMAQVHKRVLDLRDQGMVLDPTFHELTVEELTAWGHDFALVTTLEIWDLRYRSSGTGVAVSDRPGLRSRVQYQLKKVEGRWRVFHRDLIQEFDAD